MEFHNGAQEMEKVAKINIPRCDMEDCNYVATRIMPDGTLLCQNGKCAIRYVEKHCKEVIDGMSEL